MKFTFLASHELIMILGGACIGFVLGFWVGIKEGRY